MTNFGEIVCEVPDCLCQGRQYQHTFKHVFTDTAPQKELFDSVACPLIEDLVQGKNGESLTQR